MVSGDYRSLTIVCLLVFRGEGRHAAIATFRLEVHYQLNPVDDANGCRASVIGFCEDARATCIFRSG